MRIHLLHTNDIHSHFERMPRIAGTIRTLEKECGSEPVLKLDIGDHMDRMRLETEGTHGLANVEILNATGYDAVTIGNNEGLTFEADKLSQAFESRRGFDLICGNLKERESGQLPSWLKPWKVFSMGGVRVGVIGLTIDFNPFYHELGWDVSDPFEAAARLVREIKPFADVIVLMSHLGIRYDERLAGEVTDIDVILGGHTHHLFEEPVRIGNTVLCAAGKFGQYVGHVTLEWDSARKRVNRIEGRCVQIDEYPAEDDIEAIISKHRTASEIALSHPIAVLQEPIATDLHIDAPLGNLLAEGLRTKTGAEIGLVNAGQFLAGFRQGPISKAQLLAICPSPINPCRMLLKGEALLQALEESLLSEYIEMPLRGYGFRGERLGSLCVDGADIRYDRSGPPYGRIRAVTVGGDPLDPGREYVVGTIDMFTFGVGYKSLAAGTDLQFFLPEFIRDVVSEQLSDQEAVRRCVRQRWSSEEGNR